MRQAPQPAAGGPAADGDESINAAGKQAPGKAVAEARSRVGRAAAAESSHVQPQGPQQQHQEEEEEEEEGEEGEGCHAEEAPGGMADGNSDEDSEQEQESSEGEGGEEEEQAGEAGGEQQQQQEQQEKEEEAEEEEEAGGSGTGDQGRTSAEPSARASVRASAARASEAWRPVGRKARGAAPRGGEEMRLADCGPTLALFDPDPSRTRHPHTWRSFGSPLPCSVRWGGVGPVGEADVSLLEALSMAPQNGSLFFRKVELADAEVEGALLPLLERLWAGRRLPGRLPGGAAGAAAGAAEDEAGMGAEEGEAPADVGLAGRTSDGTEPAAVDTAPSLVA
jgi:hypothetical protein